ncbi:MAG: hypothetical protein N2444_00085 [Methylocystis sp.]|nr:hypothetical protein [Methylocystis sp.]
MMEDVESVRAFLVAAVEQREAGGDRRYVAKARAALAAFERIAAKIECEARAERVRDFDDVFGPDAEWRKWPG